MFGQLTAFWSFVLFVISGLVCGLLFFGGNALNSKGWLLWAVGVLMKIISIFFAIVTVIALVVLFVKAFWWAIVGLVIVSAALWLL